MTIHVCGEGLVDLVPVSPGRLNDLTPALGGGPLAGAAGIARFSVVDVPTETVRDARTQVADLVADLSRVGKGYRDDSQTVDDANDPATADMYNGYAMTIDKIRWMLQAIMDDDRLN